MASRRVALDEWVIIPIEDQRVLFGRDVETKAYRITSDLVAIDTFNPPQWAKTKSQSHYYLVNRATTISKVAYVAAVDTLLRRGHSAELVGHYLTMATRLIKECNTDEIITMFMR